MTIPHLREVNNLFSLDMIFLSETKNKEKYMDRVKNWLRFENSVVIGAMNRSSGMCLLWKDDVKVLTTLQTAFTIEAKIGGRYPQDEW